jgi:hypothetical protein
MQKILTCSTPDIPCLNQKKLKGVVLCLSIQNWCENRKWREIKYDIRTDKHEQQQFNSMDS